MRRFSPEEDAVIVEMAPSYRQQEIAEVLNRHASSIAGRIQTLKGRGLIQRQCLTNCLWTPEEDEELLYLLTLYPLAKVASQMNRSVDGCRNRIEVICGGQGVSRFRRVPNGDGGILSTEACVIFGVTSKQLLSWVRQNLLRPVGRAGYKKSRFSPPLFAPEEIRRFIRECPDRYFVEDMAFGLYRRLAEEVRREIDADPWLTPKQVAGMKGVPTERVRRNIRRGVLPARVRAGTKEQLEIRRSDALTWQPDYSNVPPHKIRKAA